MRRWARRQRIWVDREEFLHQVQRHIWMPVSYTSRHEPNWKNGNFRVRVPSKTAKPLNDGGHDVGPEDFWEELRRRGLGLYRVEGQDPDLVHIGYLNPKYLRLGTT